MRIRNNSLSENSRGESVSVGDLFRTLKPGDALNISDPRCLGSCSVYLSGLRLADGELLILAIHHLNQEAGKVYGLRWEIEALFGCLKGRGFKLEDTRVIG
nr:hypothetical protein [methane-oxidizing endosymbiont of Gigantopelta aegis]